VVSTTKKSQKKQKRGLILYSEVTIDTNVFFHAQNPCAKKNRPYGESARKFLDSIKECADKKNSIAMCVDGDWKKDTLEKDSSKIFTEYRKHTTSFGNYGRIFLETMAKKNLIHGKKKFPSPGTKGSIEKCIKTRKKQTDCVLVGVACSTDSKILASNEYEDFTKDARIDIHRTLRVSVFETRDSRLHGRLFNG